MLAKGAEKSRVDIPFYKSKFLLEMGFRAAHHDDKASKNCSEHLRFYCPCGAQIQFVQYKAFIYLNNRISSFLQCYLCVDMLFFCMSYYLFIIKCLSATCLTLHCS